MVSTNSFEVLLRLSLLPLVSPCFPTALHQVFENAFVFLKLAANFIRPTQQGNPPPLICSCPCLQFLSCRHEFSFASSLSSRLEAFCPRAYYVCLLGIPQKVDKRLMCFWMLSVQHILFNYLYTYYTHNIKSKM